MFFYRFRFFCFVFILAPRTPVKATSAIDIDAQRRARSKANVYLNQPKCFLNSVHSLSTFYFIFIKFFLMENCFFLNFITLALFLIFLIIIIIIFC